MPSAANDYFESKAVGLKSLLCRYSTSTAQAILKASQQSSQKSCRSFRPQWTPANGASAMRASEDADKRLAGSAQGRFVAGKIEKGRVAAPVQF
jgi:hypothetical protein